MMTNYRLIAVKLGDEIKGMGISQISRIARAVFDFDVRVYPNEDITAAGAQVVYNWIMTLAEQPGDEENKRTMLDQFENELRGAAGLGLRAAEEGAASAAKPSARTPLSRRVFLVHGHDEGAKEAAARLLQTLELEPIILHEQPSKGKTVIEKFEQYADVGFAVVLLTADDVAGPHGGPKAEQKHRARQNVIFELGFFIGKLGRECVCPLRKGAIEEPSDYHGVVYVEMDDHGAWRTKLAQEIDAAGIEVDLNKLKGD